MRIFPLSVLIALMHTATYASDSALVVFSITPVDSALVHIISKKGDINDTFWVYTGKKHSVLSGEYIITATAEGFSDVILDKTLPPDSQLNISCDFTKVIEKRNAIYKQSSFYAKKQGANLVVLTEPKAKVYLNSGYVGTGSLMFDMHLGEKVEIRIDASDGSGVENVMITPSSSYAVVEYYQEMTWAGMLTNIIIPGSYEIGRKNWIRGLGRISTIAVPVLLGYYQHNRYVENRALFNEWSNRYSAATSETDALNYGNRADSYHDKTNVNHSLKMSFYGVAVGAFVANIYQSIKLKSKYPIQKKSESSTLLPKFELNANTGMFRLRVSKTF